MLRPDSSRRRRSTHGRAADALAVLGLRGGERPHGGAAYLLRSWHPDARPASVEIDPDTRWLWLEIVRTERGTERDSDGVVEFRAKYRMDAPEGRSSGVQHEVSTFAREAGAWVYVDGEA
jgi:SEC-C motif-containing protein